MKDLHYIRDFAYEKIAAGEVDLKNSLKLLKSLHKHRGLAYVPSLRKAVWPTKL